LRVKFRRVGSASLRKRQSAHRLYRLGDVRLVAREGDTAAILRARNRGQRNRRRGAALIRGQLADQIAAIFFRHADIARQQHLDLAARKGELDRVGDQIPDDLLPPTRVPDTGPARVSSSLRKAMRLAWSAGCGDSIAASIT